MRLLEEVFQKKTIGRMQDVGLSRKTMLFFLSVLISKIFLVKCYTCNSISLCSLKKFWQTRIIRQKKKTKQSWKFMIFRCKRKKIRKAKLSKNKMCYWTTFCLILINKSMKTISQRLPLVHFLWKHLATQVQSDIFKLFCASVLVCVRGYAKEK